MSTLTAPSTSSTFVEDKALELLSTGIEQEDVANALGVSPGRISQLVSEPVFARKLAENRFKNLQKHNETDNRYDKLEGIALMQLERSLPLVMDPLKLSRIALNLNSAKRRGASNPDRIVNQRPIVRLNISQALVTRVAVNGMNQVVEASVGTGIEGESVSLRKQDLVTIQSSGVQRLLNEHVKTVAATAIENSTAITNESAESRGQRWVKPQGREKQDLLSELGFVHEVVGSSTGTADSLSEKQ